MATPGIYELSKLLKSMNPTLDPETYVFAHISAKDAQEDATISKWLAQEAMTHADMLYREHEGFTIIISQSEADKLGLDFIFPCKKITLNVHSSLEAVGFLAAVTSRLAKNLNIGVNPVSGYFHDHLYVPRGREELVMTEVRELAAEQE